LAETALAVTPPPEMFTAVAPLRPVPVRVTGKLDPLNPEFGPIEVKVAATTAKATELLVPPAVTTVTFRVVKAAVPVIVNVVVSCVPAPFTEMPLALTPAPEILTDVAPVRFVPVSVTLKVVLRNPELGLIADRVGVGGVTTVNAPVRVGFPPGVCTVTILVVAPALLAIVKVAVSVVLLTTTKLLTATPAPETVAPVAPARLLPEIVTGTDVPLVPDVGAIDVSLGAPRTVKAEFSVAVPPAVVTVTFLAPVAALETIVSVAVS